MGGNERGVGVSWLSCRALCVEIFFLFNRPPRRLQAWYREGLAAQALELWEDAAQAFYEAFQLDPDQPQFAQRFHQAIKSGREAHAAAQKG